MNSPTRSKFGPEVLLVFVGHSSDSEKEAKALVDLERDLQRELEQLQVAANGALPFKTARCWEWNEDAPPGVGGQNAVITPDLDRANIAVFVFKERVGAVTWSELERARGRSSPRIPVIAFFPSNPPDTKRMLDLTVAEAWTDLLRKKPSLAADWTAPDSKSLRPIPDYRDLHHLKAIALEQIRSALSTILLSLQSTAIGSTGQTTRANLLRHQLPAPPAAFTGREQELNLLETTLAARVNTRSEDSAPGAVLQGMGGVGKTTLATVLAHRLKKHYPDAQIMLNLRGFDPIHKNPMPPPEAMQRVILIFRPEDKLPETLEDLTPIYNAVLNEAGKVLLFLDNAANAEQIQPLLPPASCLLLVTSRMKFSLPGLDPHEIGCLSPGESQELLRKLAPTILGHEAVAAELCGRLPLKLKIFGRVVAERRVHTVPKLLEMLRARRQGFAPEDAAFQLSFDTLPQNQQRAWTLLAIFSAAFELDAAAAIWEVSADAATEIMQALVSANLVEHNPANGRFRLHDLVRAFCNGKLGDAERETAMIRFAGYYAKVGSKADELYQEGGEAMVQGLALFDRERIHIEAAYEWLAQNSDQASASLLGSLVEGVVFTGQDMRFHPRQRIRWLESQRKAAVITKNRPQEGRALGNLGLAYADLGEARKAIEFYEQHLVIARENGDLRGKGATLGNLGIAYWSLGDPRKAIEFYKQHLVIAREIGDRRGEGTALGNLGLAYKNLGEPRKAIEFFEQHLVIAREIGDRRGEGAALGNLGVAYADLGEPRKAIEFYEQRLVIAREIGDRRGEGIFLGNTGNAYLDLGEPRKAIEFYDQAVAILREIGGRRNEGIHLFNSALALDKLGDRVQAVARAELALKLYEAVENPNMAKVRATLEEWKKGAAHG